MPIYNKEHEFPSWRGMEDVLAKTGIFVLPHDLSVINLLVIKLFCIFAIE